MTWTDTKPGVHTWLGTALLLGMLAVQWQFGAAHQSATRLQYQAAPAPHAAAFEVAMLGERQAAATAAVLYAQSFDAQGGQLVALRDLDTASIADWLKLAGALNPASQYPTFLASRFYAGFAPPEQARALLRWIQTQYQRAPQTNWPSLAQAVHVAQYRLRDAALARDLARTLRLTDSTVQLPEWAREMEAFMLRDSDELSDARALLGALIESGQVKDERALAVMLGDLQRIERKLSQDQRPAISSRAADTSSKTDLVRQPGPSVNTTSTE